jgi:uncharacterized protein
MRTNDLACCVMIAMLASACGGASEVARPDQPTAAEALDESEEICVDGEIPAEGTPLVVNWRDDDRAALEAAMNRGVAVVRYTCDGIEVLRACRAPGGYAYSAVSRKTNVVAMRDGAEMQANFGTGLAALRGVEASVATGRTLQLAYVLVGLDATTVARVAEDELDGRCEGATHFIYDVSRGAFALDTSAGSEGMVAAEILGRGASAAGSTQRDTLARDGDVEACEAASDAHAEPIANCRAPLRVSLFALDAPGEERAIAETGTRRDARSCPRGFVYTDDQCVREGAATAYLCRLGDVEGCQRQCVAGSAGSCGRFASALIEVIHADGSGRDVIRASLAQLEEVETELRAACDEGEGPACSAVAFVRFRDLTGEARARNQREGMEFSEKACLAGDAHGCRLTRQAYTTDAGQIVGVELDPEAFASILARGCARGAALPCLQLAELYAMGYAVRQDLETAQPLAERACRGGLSTACVLAASLAMPGRRCARALTHYSNAVPRDATSEHRGALPRICRRVTARPEVAEEFLSRACELSSTHCDLRPR